MKNRNIVKGILSVGALVASPLSAAVLADPGFEGTLVDDGSGVGKWQPFSDSAASGVVLSTGNPRTGAQSMQLTLTAANGFAGAFQDVPVLAGGEMTFSGWNTITVGVTAGTEIRIEYRDSVNDVEISRTGNLVPIVTAAYTEFMLTDTVPAGADTARVVYAVQSFGAAAPQTIDLDDMSVSGPAVIPEPTGGALMLLGLAGIAMRRRR